MSLNNNRKPKLKRSVWLPTVLFIYLLGMTGYYAPRLINGGETMRLVVVFAVETAVILVLHWFLKRKEQQEMEREIDREDPN